MTELRSLLAYLEKPGVLGLSLVSEKPVVVTAADKDLPITRYAIPWQKVVELFQKTALAPYLQQSIAQQHLQLTIEEKKYAIDIFKEAEQWSLKLRMPKVEAPKASTTPTLSLPAEAKEVPYTAFVSSQLHQKIHDPLFSYLQEAKQKKASDLHLLAAEPRRLRIAGTLHAVGQPLSETDIKAAMQCFLQPRHFQEIEQFGYSDLAVSLADLGRLRLNVSRLQGTFKLCMRLIPDTIPTLQALALPEDLLQVAKYHQGMIIVAGPNGHGKSTTMAAIVNCINETSSHHIITIEDPIEFVYPIKKAVISQREVKSHTHSYERAIRASLREDPDIIVVGELRDRNSVEIALSAAETGHLVIGSINTRSAAKAIDRLIDMFSPAEQAQIRATLSGTLKLVIAQRLLPHADAEKLVIAVEMITGCVPVWNMIRDNKLFQLPTIQARGKSMGMLRFDDALKELLHQKKITAQTAIYYAENPLEMSRFTSPSSL